MRSSRFAPILALVLGACAAPAPEPAPLSAADRAAIEATSRDFLAAARANDWAAVAATYTEDAVLLPPNAPAVVGRSNIQAHFATFPPVTAMGLVNVEIEGKGDLAYVYGTYEMTIAPPGAEPIHDAGKYIEIRRKQADGSWPIYRDMYSSNGPAHE